MLIQFILAATDVNRMQNSSDYNVPGPDVWQILLKDELMEFTTPSPSEIKKQMEERIGNNFLF